MTEAPPPHPDQEPVDVSIVEQFTHTITSRVDKIFEQDTAPPSVNDFFNQIINAYEASYYPHIQLQDERSVPVRPEVTITMGQTKGDMYEGVSQGLSNLTLSDDKKLYVYRLDGNVAKVESRLHVRRLTSSNAYRDPHVHMPWFARIRVPHTSRDLNEIDMEEIDSIVELMEEEVRKGNVNFIHTNRKPFIFL